MPDNPQILSYRILSEVEPNVFKETGETYEGTREDAEKYVVTLHETNGICYALEEI